MNISDIMGITQGQIPLNEINGMENKSIPLTTKTESGPSFTQTLDGFVQDVNAMQKDSSKQSERFVKGEAVDIHDVMIAAEKAKTSFQLLMELRNKSLDVYKEAMRIQV